MSMRRHRGLQAARPRAPTVALGMEEEHIPRHAHVAYFWETDQEFAAAIGFLKAGIRGSDHCVIFGYDDANQSVCRVLQERGFDIDTLQAQQRLTVLAGSASGDMILRTVAATFAQAIAEGAPLIRLLGNIGWGKHHWPGQEDLLAFEAKVTEACQQFPCVVMCMYDVPALPGLIVHHGGFETHPYVVHGSSVRQNPYYVPTDLFLARLEAIAGEIAERRRAEVALRQSEERLRTLLEITNATITKLTRDELLHTICEALGRVIPFDRVALTLYESGLDVLRLVAFEGPFRSQYFSVGLAFDPRDSHVGWAFLQQRPLVRHDLEAEWQFSVEHRAFADGIRTMCALPLIVRGKSIGAINVASQNRYQYAAADAEFLQEVANQIAIAIDNMQSYEEIVALKARLQAENIYLQEEIKTEYNFEEIVGQSTTLRRLLYHVEQVAPTDATVLIYRETGTGKELLARAIHNLSPRKHRPLVQVNCGAIPAGLVESELFGHEKGVFTGAVQRRIGRFELAHGGTIFLDEVSELPLDTQIKLLRVLQEGEFERVGSSTVKQVDVRVIAATNRDLKAAVQSERWFSGGPLLSVICVSVRGAAAQRSPSGHSPVGQLLPQ